MRVCVFCGSAAGADPAFATVAGDLGRALARAGIGLVYGGASVGLMGIVADAALAAGGAVTGVIPEALAAREVAHRRLPDLCIVGSMHERKAMMAGLADAFVALPGGYGTLEELFEALTWAQLGLHAKPTVILNAGGYYDALLSFMDHAERCGFARPRRPPRLRVAGTVDGVMRALGAPAPTPAA
ncbi:MAG: TIGR00730 family Rossman fold protein [Pseudomonadota bacterium]|nr:TIGR00730 family Rossman fold protein [Pseudomonadota bacterium]